MPPKRVRQKCWCFTDNNCRDWLRTFSTVIPGHFSSHPFSLVEWFTENAEAVRYVCYGVETAPTTGQKHHQGYVQYKSQIYFKKAKELMPGVHLEPAKGSPQENHDYCKKDGDFHEAGECSYSGKRNDIHNCVDDIKLGVVRDEVVLNHPMVSIKYASGLRGYQEAWERKQSTGDRIVQSFVVLGPTGCGKTYLGMAEGRADEGGYFLITGADMQGKCWWNGYQGQKTLIIDEFFDECTKIQFMLRILDRYPLRLDAKYSFTYAAWTRVFITSNQNEIYSQEPLALKQAFKRRLTRVIDAFTGQGLGRLRTMLSAHVDPKDMPSMSPEQLCSIQNADTDTEED